MEGVCVFHTDPSTSPLRSYHPPRGGTEGGVRPLPGLSELNLHKDSASSSYLERERLSSHYAARGPGALRPWTPQVLTLWRRRSVGKGPHQAPKLVGGVGVGGGGKKEKAPSECMPLPPGQQRTASGKPRWELGSGDSLLATRSESLTWDQQPRFQ